VKGQPPGFAGKGSNCHAAERVAVTTGMVDPVGAAASANDRNRTWLYEMVALQLRALMKTRQLLCVATKAALMRNAADAILQHFQHEEFLDLHWNRLVNLRIILREQPEIAQTAKPRTHTASGVEGDALPVPVSRGVLRGALLKDVLAASKNAPGSSMEFLFRIGRDGVTPNQ